MELHRPPSIWSNNINNLGVCCEDESWIGYPGLERFYRVSSCGRFATCRARGGDLSCNQIGPWKLLKVHPTKEHKSHRIMLVYLRDGVKRITRSVHRCVYESFKGLIKEGLVIDHINRNSFDNHIKNLRTATQSQNQINSSNPNRGVYQLKTGKYRAKISFQHKEYWLGVFDTFEQAYNVRKEAEQKFYGEFSNK